MEVNETKYILKTSISTNKIHYQLHNAAEHLLFFSVRKTKKPKIRRKKLFRNSEKYHRRLEMIKRYY